MQMRMTLRQLELFLALAKKPHIGEVGKEVGLTQSAVSMAIKSLEEILETRLFDRINKKIVLNENGRLFLGRVEHLVLGLKEAESIFRDEHLHGEIRVGVSSSIANYIIPQIFYSFMQNYDGVTFTMETGNTREVAALIESGRVDMGFIEGEYDGLDVQHEVLGTDELYIVTGDESMVRDEPYRMEELLGKRWVLREKGSGTRETFLNHLGELGKSLNVFMELDHTGAVKSILSNKDTISCLSRFSVQKEMKYGLLHRLPVEGYAFTRSFYTIWHKNKFMSSLLTTFIEFTRNWNEGFHA
ncbi:MAG: LysR family transcriptional regulator [Desulfobacterales bacterium]|nr:LysR family transcriptional regulator [Desulfobacterales bacterium]